MELVYLCNTIGFNREIEINFSEEFKIEIRNLALIIEGKFSRIPSFYGPRISNVTAFIGRNGTGKTTNICSNIMSPNWGTYRFLVFKKHNELFVFQNPRNNYGIENKTSIKSRVLKITDLEPGYGQAEVNSKSNEELKTVLPLYYSTSYTDHPFLTRSVLSDISTSGLISLERSRIQKDFDDPLVALQFSDLIKQLSFLQSEIGQRFQQDLSVNPEIIVRSSTMKTQDFDESLLEINLFKELKNHLDQPKNKGSIDITSLSGAPRIVCIVWAYLCALDQRQLIGDYLKFLKKCDFNFNSPGISLDEEFINLNVFIGQLVNILNANIDEITNHQMQIASSLSISLQNTSFRIPIPIAPLVIEFYKKNLKKDIAKYDFVWNISSGEYSFLSLFARLFDATYRVERRNIILVIDEGDTNFHPEWSRQYVHNLIKWLPKILSRAESIQIILTTHSPYVLSDISASNVYTIRNEKGKLIIDQPLKPTFGANINELLADSFFLENGLIGKFAKDKIQTTIDNLQLNSDKEIEKLEKGEVKKIIDMIGDTFLRDKLSKMFYAKYPEEYELEKNIEETRRRLEQLMQLKNDNDFR